MIAAGQETGSRPGRLGGSKRQPVSLLEQLETAMAIKNRHRQAAEEKENERLKATLMTKYLQDYARTVRKQGKSRRTYFELGATPHCIAAKTDGHKASRIIMGQEHPDNCTEDSSPPRSYRITPRKQEPRRAKPADIHSKASRAADLPKVDQHRCKQLSVHDEDGAGLSKLPAAAATDAMALSDLWLMFSENEAAPILDTSSRYEFYYESSCAL